MSKDVVGLRSKLVGSLLQLMGADLLSRANPTEERIPRDEFNGEVDKIIDTYTDEIKRVSNFNTVLNFSNWIIDNKITIVKNAEKQTVWRLTGGRLVSTKHVQELYEKSQIND